MRCPGVFINKSVAAAERYVNTRFDVDNAQERVYLINTEEWESVMKANFTAVIGSDPVASSVTLGCSTAKAAAQAARRYAYFGEIITVHGPRGGTTHWEAVGSGDLGTVWQAGR